MTIKQTDDGKWCLYDADGKKLSEHDSEDEAKQALAARIVGAIHELPLQPTFLQGVDLKDIVTRDLAAETEVQIALTGHYVQNGREFDITLKDFADAEQNFAKQVNPLPLDYEHNTFVKGAEAPAAGWVKKVVNRGEQGLYAVVAWTQRAADAIRRGEYKFISPVFFFNAVSQTGEKVGTMLGPPALTNFPLIQGMEPVTAKRQEQTIKEKPMNELLKKIFLALAIDAGDEEITEEKAIEMLKAKMAQPDPPKRPKVIVPKSILDEVGLGEDATETEVAGAIMALKNRGDTIPVERYRQLEDSLHARDIADLVDKACRPGESDMEGKLYPHERDWALGEAKKDFDKIKAFIRHRPKVLTIMAKLPGQQADALKIDDLQASINKQLNVSPELFKKYATASN